LRAVGSENKEPKLDDMEKTLLAASRKLGIGPLGARGINAVMAMHIETAYTHTAALPVAVNAQCLVGRRWKASINASGEISYTGEIS
jgi:fumarate hydratase subunit alpha